MSDGFGIRAQFVIETAEDHARLDVEEEPRFLWD
jgi:hypothetical protein